MSVNLSSLIGGGGQWKPRFFSGYQEIAAGASGDIIELNPTTLSLSDNEFIRLTALVAATGDENDMRITVNGGTVCDGLLAYGVDPTVGAFYVSGGVFGGNTGAFATSSANRINYVESRRDGARDIIVTKTSGTTSGPIRYAYEIGVYE